MPRSHTLQSNFTAGILDPRLAARTDIGPFYEGISAGTNILCMPQGGIKRRPGMAFIADIGEDAVLAPFIYSTEASYLVVFKDQAIDIYKNDTLQASISSPYVAADLAALRWTQSADTMLIVHGDYEPRKLFRGGSDSAWSLLVQSFSNIPQVNFNDYLSPSAVSEVQTLTFPGGWVGGETFTLTLESNVTATINYDASTATTAANIQAALRALGNTDSAGITVAFSAGTTYNVTFAGNDSGRNWEEMTSTVLTGGGSITHATTTEGAAGLEDAWSSTRGWPKNITFFESRLWLGGTTKLPQSIFASKSASFFDFNLGTSLDDEGIFVTLDTDQVNAITGMYGGRNMQIFTSGGEFYINSAPVTPTNVSVRRQSNFGSTFLSSVVSIDGATMFIDRSGKTLREFIYSYEEEAYNANAISMLAPHLINNPVDMAAYKSVTGDEANYIYLVNQDGTMAVLNSLRSENINAWTKWTTNGEVLNIAVVLDNVYFLVKRTINSVTEYYLERIDEATFTDCNIDQTLGTPATTVTGLAHLNGEECRVKADGAVLANKTPSGGSITTERTVTQVEVGLNFDPLITTMPLNQDYAGGPTLTKDKRIGKVQLDLYESLGVYVNNILMPSRTFGTGILDGTPEPFTGLKEVFLMGWSEIAQVNITQQDPLPMTVLGAIIDVEVSSG